ncbi:MAG: hypothetical protein ACK5U8_15670 [Deltaproteobacteria bacterium]
MCALSPVPPAFLAILLAGAGGCTCAADHDRHRAGPPISERGGEARAAVAYPVEEPSPARDAFSLTAASDAVASLGAATRAGSWSGLRRGGEERRSAGNFLCRLEALYGRAPIVLPDRVAVVLLAEETGLVLVAAADAGGPWIGVDGGRLADPDAQDVAAQAAIELARLIDATAPTGCVYEIGGTAVGVRGGAWF